MVAGTLVTLGAGLQREAEALGRREGAWPEGEWEEIEQGPGSG